jgi:hypothetical protein
MAQVGEKRWWLAQILVLSFLLAGAVCRARAQTGLGETVVQKAIRQFESTPLQKVSLGNHIFLFSGDGGNVVAIAEDADTLLIDSGVDSRASELQPSCFPVDGSSRDPFSEHSLAFRPDRRKLVLRFGRCHDHSASKREDETFFGANCFAALELSEQER